MFKLLRKVGARINRHAGLSIQWTYLYRISRPAGWKATLPVDEGVRCELLLPENVSRLSEIEPFDVSEGLQRLRRGDCCYTVCTDGQPVHFSWVQRSGLHPISDGGVSIPTGNGEFWIYHCSTVKWARGKGIYPATLKRIVEDHFSAGYGIAWIYTTRSNIASQRGILRAGFSKVATLRAIRAGSRHFRLGRTDQAQ
jgi:RimJ/RimL family protein N-acetyltransferase